jgi:hypothetical protein
MSTLTGISSSASASYATQLAQTFSLKRSLSSLGTAVQNGDMDSAGSILTALIKANPQFAATASEGSQSQNPINQGFQALADAISSGQTDTAQSAWTQVKSDLAKSGVTDLSDGTAATAKLVADSRDSLAQQILSDSFGATPGAGLVASLLAGSGPSAATSLLSTLLGDTSSSTSSQTGLSSSLLSSWLTYKAGGTTATPVAPDSTGLNLDTAV